MILPFDSNNAHLTRTDNHNVMVGYTPSTGMIVQWKNCDTDEDCNGQRMLYSHSTDGRTWSSPPRILFPNMTTPGVRGPHSHSL